jgi:hypothetical protein
VLAVQFVAAVCSPHGPYQCTGCGIFYRPGRKPRRDRENHYCSSCAEGDNAAKRLSAERKRARTRAVPEGA